MCLEIWSDHICDASSAYVLKVPTLSLLEFTMPRPVTSSFLCGDPDLWHPQLSCVSSSLRTLLCTKMLMVRLVTVDVYMSTTSVATIMT